MADGVQQVGLAEPDAAVEEERVVAVRGALGDGPRGGVRELVGAADDEGVEGVLRVEAVADRPSGRSTSFGADPADAAARRAVSETIATEKSSSKSSAASRSRVSR